MAEIEKLQNQVISLVSIRNDVRAKLESAAPLVLGVRNNVEMEAHQKAMLDAVHDTLTECVALLLKS